MSGFFWRGQDGMCAWGRWGDVDGISSKSGAYVCLLDFARNVNID